MTANICLNASYPDRNDMCISSTLNKIRDLEDTTLATVNVPVSGERSQAGWSGC